MVPQWVLPGVWTAGNPPGGRGLEGKSCEDTCLKSGQRRYFNFVNFGEHLFVLLLSSLP